MTPFHRLPMHSPSRHPILAHLHRHVHLDDRALTVFTDFRLGPRVIAEAGDSLDATAHLMTRAGVGMVFVADASGAITGLVTQADLHGERPIVSARSDGRAHDELVLGDVMTPLTDWPMVDLFEIRHASIGDVVETLQGLGRRYLLVTETRDGQTELRGLFSARSLEEALDMPIEDDGHSRSFAQLEVALLHGSA